MRDYMKDLSEVIGYVESIASVILDIMSTSYTSEDEKEADLKYYLAIYSLMILKNF